MKDLRKYIFAIGAVLLLCGLSYIKTAFMGLDPASYSSINAAVSAAGTGKVTMIVSSTQTLAGSLTIPSNVTLKVLKTGLIVGASTYTLTINGNFEAAPYQCFSNFLSTQVVFGDNSSVEKIYPQWWGAIVNGLTNDTTAFASALYAVPAGGKIHLIPGTYNVKGALTMTKNRITIEGEGVESNINYTPAVSSTTFMTGSGSLDNVRYAYFTVHMTNPTTKVKTTGFYHPNADTSVEWDHVTVSNFNEYGIHLGTGLIYCKILDCRFIQIRDTLSQRVAIAIYGDGGQNVTRILRNFFSENDRSIHMTSGSPIQCSYNSMEVDGDSGNTLIDYNQYFNQVKGLDYSYNYVEGSSNPTNGAALRINDCINSHVAWNYMAGMDGPNDRSNNLVMFTGTNTFNAVVEGNSFDEVIRYFVNTAVPITLKTNWYRDGGTVKSTVSTIQALLTDTSLIDMSQWVGNIETRTSSHTVTDSLGRTTHPTQPCWLYTSTGAVDVTGDGTTYTMLWGQRVYDVNIGMSTGTSNMTAPVTGKYLICAQVTMEGVLNTHNNFTLTINTSARQYQQLKGGLIARNDESMEMCTIADMTAGDTCNIRIVADSGTKVIDIINDARYNRFTGTLID